VRIELLWVESAPLAGLVLNAEAPATFAFFDRSVPDGRDGLPSVARWVGSGSVAADISRGTQRCVPEAIGDGVDHLLRWDIRRLAARGVDAAAWKETMRGEAFDEISHNVHVWVRSGVDEQGHKGRVVFCTDVANRWLHVGEHAAPPVVDHPLAIGEKIHSPLAPFDNRLAFADDEADSIEKVWRQTKIGLLRRVRQALGGIEECQRITAVPS